jgi:hypothetical protein
VLSINIYPAEKTETGITLIPGAGILRGINLMGERTILWEKVIEFGMGGIWT